MYAVIDDAQSHRLLQGIRIPPQPRALLAVRAEQAKDDPDLGAIIRAVSTDVGMAAALLKAANSAAFGGGGIGSIHQAVFRLGLNNTVHLVNGLALRMAMAGLNKMSLERFWNSAADTALVCANLVRQLKAVSISPGQAHALGLFHDCGIPLLLQRFPHYLDILKAANASPDKTFIEVEDAALNTNHAVVAYLVARSWQLPEVVVDTIRDHHCEDMLGDAANSQAEPVALLTLAGHLTHRIRRAADDLMWERVGDKVLATLSLSTSEYQELESDAEDWIKGNE